MGHRSKLMIAAILFLIYGAIALYSGWFGGSARQAEEKLQSAIQTNLELHDLDKARVKVDGQLAIISGTARSESEKQKIIRTVRSSKWSGGLISGGVTVVRSDNLQVVELPDTPETPFVWTAEKDDDGSVLISGMIPDEAARDLILAHARVRFPDGALDRMSVARNAPPGDWVTAAKLSLDTLAQLQSGRATGDGSRFNVSGKALTREIANVAEDALRDLPQGFRGHSQITSPPPQQIQSPYVWGAILDDAGKPVILNGYVPDREIQVSIIAHAESLFKQRVVDRMVVTAGVPEGDWEDTVKSALTTLASLQTGRASASDFDFSITGVAPSEDTVNNARTIMSGLSGEYSGNVDLSIAPPARVEEVDQCQALFDNAMRETTINFETSKATIRADSFLLLDRLSIAARRCNAFDITISGHTDSVGSETLNLSLSERRAQAVVSYLIEAGVNSEQLSSRGFGESNPVGDNSTPEGRAQNRRIEFTIEQ